MRISKQLLKILKDHTTDSLAKGISYVSFRCEADEIISRHRLSSHQPTQVLKGKLK